MNSLKNSNKKKYLSRNKKRYVKECLAEYYYREFDLIINFNEKLIMDKEIELAYTEDEDGTPSQITTIILKNEFYVYMEEKKIKTIFMDRDIYLENLKFMNFNWLINL